MLAGSASAQDAPLVLQSAAGALAILPADVASASLFQPDGSVVVRVTLRPVASSALAELTRAALGERIEIRFCGDLLTEPRVRMVLEDGRFVLGGPLGDDAPLIVSILLGQAGCPGLSS
jgi:hypothetical protein